MTAARVVIVGSVNRDLLLGCDRLPQPGETVTGATASRGLGGKGANAAVAVARLGGHAQLVALLGEDEAGAGARSELSEAGVDVAFVGSVPGSTGFAVVVTGASGENLIVVVSGANAVLDESRVVSALESLDDAPTAVLANLEVPLPAVEAASRAAEVRGWPFVLDPAPASGLPAELLRRCSVLVPNRRELKGLHPDGAEALLRLGAGAVVTTLGAEGAELATGEGTRQWPAPEVAVRDTVGAGDAFAAALALSVAEGTTLPEAVEIAVAAGALSTRGAGAQGSLPTRPELLACVRPSLG